MAMETDNVSPVIEGEDASMADAAAAPVPADLHIDMQPRHVLPVSEKRPRPAAGALHSDDSESSSDSDAEEVMALIPAKKPRMASNFTKTGLSVAIATLSETLTMENVTAFPPGPRFARKQDATAAGRLAAYPDLLYSKMMDKIAIPRMRGAAIQYVGQVIEALSNVTDAAAQATNAPKILQLLRDVIAVVQDILRVPAHATIGTFYDPLLAAFTVLIQSVVGPLPVARNNAWILADLQCLAERMAWYIVKFTDNADKPAMWPFIAIAGKLFTRCRMTRGAGLILDAFRIRHRKLLVQGPDGLTYDPLTLEAVIRYLPEMRTAASTPLTQGDVGPCLEATLTAVLTEAPVLGFPPGLATALDLAAESHSASFLAVMGHMAMLDRFTWLLSAIRRFGIVGAFVKLLWETVAGNVLVAEWHKIDPFGVWLETLKSAAAGARGSLAHAESLSRSLTVARANAAAIQAHKTDVAAETVRRLQEEKAKEEAAADILRTDAARLRAPEATEAPSDAAAAPAVCAVCFHAMTTMRVIEPCGHIMCGACVKRILAMSEHRCEYPACGAAVGNVGALFL